MDKPSIIKNRGFYPECYIPERLLKYFEGYVNELVEKNRPKFTELEPLPPVPPEKPHFSETVTALLIPSFIGLFFHFKIFLIVIFALLIVAAFHYIRIKRLHPKLIKNYNSVVSSYEALMTSYLQKADSFKKLGEKYNSDLNSYRFINSLIVKELKETFETSPKASVFVQSPKKGKSELQFKNHLVEYFGGAIQDDCTIEIFQYSKKNDFDFPDTACDDDKYSDITNCYVPDFCFTHPTKSLKIDIEIDESYSYTPKKPIHYFGSENRRNQYFVDKNWIVLRFSEQQVQKAPKECCREIAEVIYDFTNDGSYINKLLTFDRLTRVKKWTLDDATNHIAINHRQYYQELENNVVIKDFINGLWEDGEITYEFAGTVVKKVLKQKHLVEKAWQKYSGIFYLSKDKLNRYCVNILWDTNHIEYLIIDNLVKGSLTITNMYTRAIYRLSSTHGCEKVPLNVYYDESSRQNYSIDEIKQIFRYEKLPLCRLYNEKQKTEYLYYLDERQHIVLTVDQNLVSKISSEKNYNQIKIGKPRFLKFDERNRITIALTDV